MTANTAPKLQYYDCSCIAWAKTNLDFVASNGNPAWENFIGWFDSSKTLDDSGVPLVLYHGSPNGMFDEFDTSPIFFTDSRKAAVGYAEGRYSRDDNHTRVPHVVCAYLSIKNPRYYTEAELSALLPGENGTVEWADFDNLAFELEREGYDGVIVFGTYDYMGGMGGNTERGRYNQYIVFNPEQIKSAVATSGIFDSQNPNIF